MMDAERRYDLSDIYFEALLTCPTSFSAVDIMFTRQSSS